MRTWPRLRFNKFLTIYPKLKLKGAMKQTMRRFEFQDKGSPKILFSVSKILEVRRKSQISVSLKIR